MRAIACAAHDARHRNRSIFLLQLVLGDAADVLAAEAGSATAETITMLRAQFGLDQSILSQLLRYLGNFSHFSPGSHCVITHP
ncbi:MAG: hypothetical protein ACR5LD_10850 [Symbiopectobacterium sp.]